MASFAALPNTSGDSGGPLSATSIKVHRGFVRYGLSSERPFTVIGRWITEHLMVRKTTELKVDKDVTGRRLYSTSVQSKRQFSMRAEQVSDFFGFMRFVMYELPKRLWFIDTIYRGQADANWPPEPKLDRPDFERWRAEVGGSRRDHESLLLRDFKRMARPYLDLWPRDEWEWLAIAQHHGLCTRLLDWTRNPLVALYFATENLEDKKDCAVWCYFHMGARSEDRANPFKSRSVILFEPPHISPRITAQTSCLTAHPRGGNPSGRTWRGKLVKIVIPSYVKAQMKDCVNTLGINRASLFPDLDGVGSHINRGASKAEWEEYL
jgi:hypothetical protein